MKFLRFLFYWCLKCERSLNSFRFLISGNDKLLSSTFGMNFLLDNCLKSLLFCFCPLSKIYTMTFENMLISFHNNMSTFYGNTCLPYEIIIISSWLVRSRLYSSRSKTNLVLSLLSFESNDKEDIQECQFIFWVLSY